MKKLILLVFLAFSVSFLNGIYQDAPSLISSTAILSDLKKRELLDKSQEKVNELQKKYDKAVADWNALTPLQKTLRWVDLGSKLAVMKAEVEAAKAAHTTLQKTFGK